MSNYLQIGSDIAEKAYEEANTYLQAKGAARSSESSRVSFLGSLGGNISSLPSVTYNDNSWKWGNHTTVINNPKAPARSDEKKGEDKAEEKKEETNYATLAIGTGILLAGVAALGTVYNSFIKANKALNDKMTLQIEAAENQSKICQEVVFQDELDGNGIMNNFSMQDKVIHLTEKMVEVQEIQTSKINNYVYSCFIAIAGATAIIGGSFVAKAILVPVGIVAVIAAASLAVFNYTSHLEDEELLEEGYRAQKTLALEVNPGLNFNATTPVTTQAIRVEIPVAVAVEGDPVPSAPPK